MMGEEISDQTPIGFFVNPPHYKEIFMSIALQNCGLDPCLVYVSCFNAEDPSIENLDARTHLMERHGLHTQIMPFGAIKIDPHMQNLVWIMKIYRPYTTWEKIKRAIFPIEPRLDITRSKCLLRSE